MRVHRSAPIFLLSLLLWPVLAEAGDKGVVEDERGVKRVWYNGDREQIVVMSQKEVAVFHSRQQASRRGGGSAQPEVSPKQRAEALATKIGGAEVVEAGETLSILRIPSPQGRTAGDTEAATSKARAALGHEASVARISPVFYRGPRSANALMALTGEVVVHFAEAQTAQQLVRFAEEHSLALVKTFDFSPNTCLFRVVSDVDSLSAANGLRGIAAVKYAYPNWLCTVRKMPGRVKAAPKDDPR